MRRVTDHPLVFGELVVQQKGVFPNETGFALQSHDIHLLTQEARKARL
jgi:hypothetical protein